MTGVPTGRRAAVFLDRDGVLNAALPGGGGGGGAPRPPAGPGDVAILPGAAEACARLRAAGFVLVGVTNQPDIARGAARPEAVAAINALVAEACGLDEIRLCPHDDADGCACRKPKPGMLLAAARERGLDPRASWMVGDRWRDVEAGRAAGARTALVGPGWPERPPAAPPDIRAPDLAAAAAAILLRGAAR